MENIMFLGILKDILSLALTAVGTSRKNEDVNSQRARFSEERTLISLFNYRGKEAN